MIFWSLKSIIWEDALFWAKIQLFGFFLWKCWCSHSCTQGIDIFCVNIYELCCHWSQTINTLFGQTCSCSAGWLFWGKLVISHNFVGLFGKIWMPRGFVHCREVKNLFAFEVRPRPSPPPSTSMSSRSSIQQRIKIIIHGQVVGN